MNLQSKIRSSLPPSHGMGRSVRGGLWVAALVLVPLLAVAGSDGFRAMLDFTTGVLSLVSLTAAVAWGLIATDRLLLSPRHRLLAQGIHRFMAMASLGFLLLHATVKIALGHVALIGAVLPFSLGITGTNGLIGFGSLAGFLMVTAAATGALRSAFAVPGKIAGRWRALHMLAYPAWCFALMHGLYAGRAAATWVMTLYCLALIAVIGAVSVRLLPRPVRRRIADTILELTGGVRETPEPDRPDRPERRDPNRDLDREPLPGTAGMPRVEFEQRFPRPRPASAPASPPASAVPLGPPLGATRVPPRIAPPSPPLYEAGRPPGADPFADPFADTFAAPGTRTGAGTGLSAGYRAVSLGAEPPARTPAPTPSPAPFGGPPGPPDPLTSSTIPYAERVPMTEEIPVISEPSAAGAGLWPTPSPPPPVQAHAPAPAPADPYQQDYQQQETYQRVETNQRSDTYLQSAPYPQPDAAPGPDLYQQADPYRQSDDTFQQHPANGGGTPSAGEPWYPPAGDRP
ncbi:hypothetical protein [Streptomyces sp. NBC_01506]|uniref:hypothetical protein n=1 Tax=Streptomyces sp. NBC_01506 TaxID=2903887 RepID=UPI0038673160